MPVSHVHYEVGWSEEDGEWVATSPEFPSLSWLAETPQDAIAGYIRMVQDVINELETEASSQNRVLAAC
ncbi:UNVERIFIED_ORG: hypothetical protein EDC92_1062 [Dietzia maris]